MTKVDIISGFLGAGKTTLIKKLIAEVFSGQQIVLIENEFGEIGIDGGFLKDAGINIKACSHITGGGFYENIPRMLPEKTVAAIKKDSYPVPPVFSMLSSDGGIEERMMYNTFNMGIGMMLALDGKDADAAIRAIEAAGEKAYVVGRVIPSVNPEEKGAIVC